MFDGTHPSLHLPYMYVASERLLSIVILQIHYSSDGRRLYASASKDGAIKVQNLEYKIRL